MTINLLFPPRCALCDHPTENAPSICTACFSNLHLISEPFCAICGRPFEHDMGHSHICIPCQTTPPAYDRARAALLYDTHSRKLITRLKFGDRTDLISLGSALMSQAGHELFETTDLIIPVPLHWRRLVFRKFNQSTLYAQALAQKHHIPCLPHALKRVRATAPQTTLNWQERQHNVHNAFVTHPRYTDTLKGKNILLIDDVYTTGATITACCKALKKAKASSVFVLTLARRMPTD